MNMQRGVQIQGQFTVVTSGHEQNQSMQQHPGSNTFNMQQNVQAPNQQFQQRASPMNSFQNTIQQVTYQQQQQPPQIVSALQRLLVPGQSQQPMMVNVSHSSNLSQQQQQQGFVIHQQPRSNAPLSSDSGNGSSGINNSILSQQLTPVESDSTNGVNIPVLTKQRLEDLVREVDPYEQLDDDVKDALLQYADEFIDSVADAACQLAKHRKANTLEAKDVQLALERNWNMWIPGFETDEFRPPKKSCTAEAHKQRMALIKKTLRKI